MQLKMMIAVTEFRGRARLSHGPVSSVEDAWFILPVNFDNVVLVLSKVILIKLRANFLIPSLCSFAIRFL